MASMQHFETLEMQAKKLVGDEPVHLINLLYDLSSSDNTVRSNAESVYNCCKREYPYSLSIGLAYLLRGSTMPETRTMSALLLRQLLTRFRWPQIQSQIQDTLKSICIECLETETSPEVSKNLCNLVSDIAKNLLPRFEWPELQSFMLTSLSSGLSHVRELGLLLFIELIPHYAEIFSPHVDTIHAAFSRLR
ncbi:uncharacterized protein LOC132316269 [Cornus florida]|uniref:uncharacterized protein LOC132316269 n=1 Tax=Cornus florida TaxID=4283 RepID=UPI00289DC276|nr:uncharacterized protein LOC132316269 [Cornus florida]